MASRPGTSGASASWGRPAWWEGALFAASKASNGHVPVTSRIQDNNETAVQKPALLSRTGAHLRHGETSPPGETSKCPLFTFTARYSPETVSQSDSLSGRQAGTPPVAPTPTPSCGREDDHLVYATAAADAARRLTVLIHYSAPCGSAVARRAFATLLRGVVCVCGGG